MEWSTDTVRPRERFAYWQEVLCRLVFNLTVEAPSGHFAARTIARSAGPLRIALSESTGYRLFRSRRDVESAADDSYAIYLPLRSHSVIKHDGQVFTFQPNDIAIYGLQQPFSHTFADGGRRVTAVIPREMIDRCAPWMRKTALHRLAANAPYVDLARRHIIELAEKPSMSESATTLLSENLCNLLALASAIEIAPARMQPELQIEAMLAFCRKELHNADLTPQRVADHLGISIRTLHLRFKRIGQSFGRWLLEERLKACAAALRDPNQRDVNISETAYRWGFNDLSHFNKSFRARFDRTPAEWRDGAER